MSKVITNNQSFYSLSKKTDHVFKRLHTLSGQRHRIYTVQNPTQRKRLRSLCAFGAWQGAPYCGHGYVQLRFGGGGGGRRYENGNTTRLRKKKEILAQKRNQGFLSKKTRKKSLTAKKKFCPNLNICRLFRVFISASVICTVSRT